MAAGTNITTAIVSIITIVIHQWMAQSPALIFTVSSSEEGSPGWLL